MAANKNFNVYCSDGRYDKNYYVKATSSSKARKLVEERTKCEVGNVREMDAEDLEDFEINPNDHELNAPYLYDSGT